MSTNPAGMYIISSALPILGTAAIASRFYVRHLKKAPFLTDDWTALAGLCALWGVVGVILNGTVKGLFGTHSKLDPVTQDLIVTRESPNVKYAWVVQIVTIAALLFIKMSVIFLYRRIFHISRLFNIYSIGLSILLVLWGIAFIFANIFQCGTKPEAFWTGAKAILKYCDDTGGANVALCFSDLIIDVMILVAPVSMIWKMSISTTRKLQVLAVFALGFISTAAASVRVYIMWVDAYGTKLGHRDVLDENTRVVIWCMVEITSALVGCCLPTLRPLFSNSSLGSFVRSLRYKMSSSRSSQVSDERKAENGMAPASIGGTKWMARKNESEKDCMVDSMDVSLTTLSEERS